MIQVTFWGKTESQIHLEITLSIVHVKKIFSILFKSVSYTDPFNFLSTHREEKLSLKKKKTALVLCHILQWSMLKLNPFTINWLQNVVEQTHYAIYNQRCNNVLVTLALQFTLQTL